MSDAFEPARWIDAALTQGIGSRHAALLVHALAPTDREWLLSRLGMEERSALQPLLDELTHLGIPPDADLVRDAAQGVPASEATPDTSERGIVQRVDCLDPSAIVAALREEPAAIAHRLLTMHEWRWSVVVANMLDGGVTFEPRHSTVDPQRAISRFDRLLLEALLRRMRDLSGGRAAPARPPASHAWLARLRRWRSWERLLGQRRNG
jgi:hypothetical protein